MGKAEVGKISRHMLHHGILRFRILASENSIRTLLQGRSNSTCALHTGMEHWCCLNQRILSHLSSMPLKKIRLELDSALFLGAFLLLLLMSCSGARNTGQPVATGRVVENFFSNAEGEATGPAHLKVGGYVFVQPALTDRGRLNEYVSKIELDFGDGGGWKDVTDHAFHVWDDLDPTNRQFHTYALPGTYLLKSRVTFWDGTRIDRDFPTFTVTESP